MINVRRGHERGHFNHGWLDTFHTFSFADYYDPDFMGFRALRVINEDRVAPGRGFGTHGHANMEIITYIVEGALEHKDSTGSGSVIRPGDVQHMSAGSGIRHSEFNASKTDPVHLYQIWILPNVEGIDPGYEDHTFDRAATRNRLEPLVTPNGRDGSLSMSQDASLYAALLSPGKSLQYDIAAGRHAWLQIVRGAVSIGPHALEAGDGAAISGERSISLTGSTESEILLFDLA
ncbi:MAG: pirin family protein [Candidatus Hydrogenedentes bacterium]|nr:pirin family protein [Candidatus Hydrogenedentota bacterium]